LDQAHALVAQSSWTEAATVAAVIESCDAPRDVRSDAVMRMYRAEDYGRYQIKDGMALEEYDKMLRE